MVSKTLQALTCLLGLVTLATGIYFDHCGLSTGGAIIQQVTSRNDTSPRLSSSTGLFWAGKMLYYVDGRQAKLCVLHKDGRNKCTELPGIENATGVYAIKGIKNKLVLLADRKSILLNLKLNKNDDIVSLTHNVIRVTFDDEAYKLGGSASDSRGNLWKGAYKGLHTASVKGILYKTDKNLVTKKENSDFKLIDGMDFSADFKKLFVVDAVEKVVYKFDYNLKKGKISNKEIVFNSSQHIIFKGFPSTVKPTYDGKLWIAMCVDGMLLHYDYKKKQILQVITIPASYPISLEFNRDALFVGTTKYDEETAKTEPGSGQIFAISGTGTWGPCKQKLPQTKLIEMKDLIVDLDDDSKDYRSYDDDGHYDDGQDHVEVEVSS